MKNLFSPAVLLLCLTLTLFSCKKDNDKSKTDLLTQSTWKQTNSGVVVGGVFTSDWDATDVCNNDDLTNFKTDKTYQVTEGATKCNPADPDLVESGSWNFNGDETALVVDGTSAAINTLDGNSLVLTFDAGGTSYRVSFGH